MYAQHDLVRARIGRRFDTERRCGRTRPIIRRGGGLRVAACLATVLLLLCIGLSFTSEVRGQDIQFGLSGDAVDTVAWEASHTRTVGYCPNCPECRAFRLRSRTYRRGTMVCPPCYPMVTPDAEAAEPSPDMDTGDVTAEDDSITAPPIESVPDVPDLGQLSSTYGGTQGAQSAAPNMIGDSLIGGGVVTHQGFDSTRSANAVALNSFHMFKIAEDESPWPKNRVYFNVNGYNNVPGTDDLTRLMVGFEKTLLDRQASIGMRLPIWLADVEPLVSDSVPFGAPGSSGEVGDLTLTLKGALLMDEAQGGVLTSGISFTFPTGSDTLANVDPYYRLVNVGHRGAIQPWLGFYRTVGGATLQQGLFSQGFMAFDVPYDPDDGSYFFLDIGLGYRIPRCPNRWITAVTPMFEAHWSNPFSNRDQPFVPTPLAVQDGVAPLITPPGVGLGGLLAYRNQVNLTTGVNLEIANTSTVALAFVVPTVGPQIMDYELICQMNVFSW